MSAVRPVLYSSLRLALLAPSSATLSLSLAEACI